ncbi:CcdB family protein [Thiohalomonas denitrificans]|uniref:CcdB family protein n=1 Tax=Thiohalomonas denitrificans TaxID=415747 RepID=UPI0026ED3432|nr:CcdB family protein [Thiohalomonas denitrificans]
MVQFAVYRGLDTRVVAPLVRLGAFGRPISVLNPVFTIESNEVVLSTAELAGVSTAVLGPYVTSLSEKRDEVIAALDLLFTGF